jgi:cytochrome c
MTIKSVSSALLAAALGVAATVSTASAQDLSPAGKRVFMRCMACHSIAAGAPNKVGPNLSGVVGRKAGMAKGFNYSAAMKKQKLVWNDAALDRWLQRPTAVVPGTSMVFAGLPSPADRKAVIAYLKKPVP